MIREGPGLKAQQGHAGIMRLARRAPVRERDWLSCQSLSFRVRFPLQLRDLGQMSLSETYHEMGEFSPAFPGCYKD